MGTYYYDGQVKFDLPWDYEYSKEYDDEGKESDHIKTGSYYNDDGEKCYKFSCVVALHEASEDRPAVFLRDLLKEKFQGESKTRTMMFDGDPEAALVTRGMPMNLFGTILQYYMLIAFVCVGGSKIVSLTTVQTYKEDDEDENLAVFENMATIIRSMSVNGKKNDLQGMGAQALHTALKPCFNEEDNIDIGARLWEMLGGSEEEMSYADQPLPDGVCASEDGYAVINEDWAVRLPDGWVFSTEEEHTCGRPFAAISREEYDESGRGPFAYGDNCFTVFRVAEAESNEYGMHSLLAGLMNSNEETVIDRPGLKVSYNCRHEENSTYCQYVTVTTYRASYMIQLFYTDPDLGEFSRVMKIEEILKTICHSYEVPFSERYQRREHAKPATTPVKTAKKNNISFIRAYPDESLYPHYNSLLNSPLKSLGFLGVNVVVNSTGTEYEFQSFHSMLNSFSSDPDENLSDTQRDRLTRILNSDTAAYDLHEKAKAMQDLFHVEPSVFDPKHDRECELEHSLMHRAYMMSALRSFAWTLSAYCKESGETPATVDYSCIRDLIAYIASHNWLNYDGESHCDGLCGGSDLHVYFVPDSTSVEDRRQLRGDGMSEEEEARIREKFQNFNIIRSQVQSLDALRRDLTYIYPAIEKIYNTLKTSRNNREQLLGDEADILYAWCALALAAKEPFFSEDGPMNYWFDQKETEEEAEANRLQQEKAVYDAWIAKYGAYLAPDPQISFSGKLFVFSGLATHADPKDHPTIQKVLDRGGEFRSKVSGLTDYLVIDPVFGGGSKLNTAIEQQKKGKPVQIILLKDLEAALGETVSPSAKKNCSCAAEEEPMTVSAKKANLAASAGCKLDGTVLTKYDNSVPCVVIPNGVTAIDRGAFIGGTNLKSVHIPETVQEIGESAFNGCDALTTVMLPRGVKRIGDFAFYSNNLEEIFIPATVERIGTPILNEYGGFKLAHVEEGSFAEQYCCDRRIPYDTYYDDKGGTTGFVTTAGMLIKYNGPGGEIVIPNDVRVIGTAVFQDNETINAVHIPEGVQAIDNYAFDNCVNLKEVSLPSSLEKLDYNAFGYCADLKHITIYSGIAQCDSDAFEDCQIEHLVIAEGSKQLEWYMIALLRCVACEPDEIVVTKVGNWVFEGSPRFAALQIPDTIATIGKEAFCDLSGLYKIFIPDGIEKIGYYAFGQNPEIQHIEMTDSVVEIEDSAFAFCGNLVSVVLSKNLRSISKELFCECENLTDVSIPDNVVSVGEDAFAGCKKIRELYVPDSVREIGKNAFPTGCLLCVEEGSYAEEYCKQQGLTYHYPGENIKTDVGANQEKTVIFAEEKEESISKDFVIKNGELVAYKGKDSRIVIPEGITAIQSNAFFGYTEAEEILLPNTVREIGEGAFYRCGKLKSICWPATAPKIPRQVCGFCESLCSVVIPEGVTDIGGSAFVNCRNLEEVFLPASVKEIDETAFLMVKNAMFHVYAGSFAETFVKEEGLQYQIVEYTENRQGKEMPQNQNELMPAIKETTHLVILANFWKNGIYSKGFEFPGDFGITFDAEQTIFNWKTCNRADDVETGIDGLGSAVNFTSVFMSGGKKIGGLYDALIECYGPKGDALHDEFYTEIASALKNDSAISLILASVIPQNGKMCGSWIVMDYSDLTLKADKVEWADSESEALEKAKARMEELARQCQTAAEEKTRKEMEEKRHREEEAQFRALQRARQEAEAERKRKEEEAERKRKAVEEAERQRQAELVAKRTRYDEISNAINLQMQIIAQNKGWFGAQAKARKAAQEQLTTLQAQLAKEFPNGKP